MIVKANIPTTIEANEGLAGGLFMLLPRYSGFGTIMLTDYMNPIRSMYPNTAPANLVDKNRYIKWEMQYGFMYSDQQGTFYTDTPFVTINYRITRDHWLPRLPNGTEDTSAAKSDCISIFAGGPNGGGILPDLQYHRRISFENWGRFTVNDQHAFGPFEKFYRWASLDLSQITTTHPYHYPSYSSPHVTVADFDSYSMGVEAGRNKFMFECYNKNNMNPPYEEGQENWDICNTSSNGLYHGHYYSTNPSGLNNTANVLSRLSSDHYNNIITNWIGNAQTTSIVWTQNMGTDSYDSTITTPRTIYTKSGALNNVQTSQIISFISPIYSYGAMTPVSPAPLFPGYSDFGSLYVAYELINIGYLYVKNIISIYDSESQTWVEYGYDPQYPDAHYGTFYTGGPGVLKMCGQHAWQYCPSGLYIEDVDYNGEKFHMCICPAMVGLDPGLDIYYPGKGVAIKSSDNYRAHEEAANKYGFPFSTNWASTLANDFYGIHIFRAGNGDKTIEEIRQNYTLNTQGSAGLSEFRTVLSNTYIP